MPLCCALRLHRGRPPKATPDSNLYMICLYFHWRQIRMVTYIDVGKQTSLSNHRNTYIHIAFTRVWLFYGYCTHICINPAFTWCFELKTQLFNMFFACGDSMGWLFHAMESLWFLKIRNSFCLRLWCVYIGRNFWGDFWGWMGCGVPCAKHPQYNVGVTTGDPCMV